MYWGLISSYLFIVEKYNVVMILNQIITFNYNIF